MTATEKTLVIANPKAAGGRVGRRWNQLSADISAEYGPVTLRPTRGIRHATAVAQQEGPDYDTVVALGGDGTIGEVVDGLMHLSAAERPVFAVLPFGSGGDFRRSLALPNRLAEAARKIRQASVRAIDVGRVSFTTASGAPETRHFVNISSFGISGLVDRLVNESSKVLGGRLSFAWATLCATRQYQPATVNLTLDSVKTLETPIQTVAVANGRYFGGGMKVAPDALLDDGLFDLVVVRPLSTMRTLHSGIRIYRGTHVELKEVLVRRCSKLEAKAPKGVEVLLDLDGETPGRLPASYELLPAALRIKA